MASYRSRILEQSHSKKVLILIVVDNGLVQIMKISVGKNGTVLILIVVDNGLVQKNIGSKGTKTVSLNPYCSGQWPRTKN